MRPVPFQFRDVARLGAAAAAPLLPLGLTIFSFEELVTRLIKILSDKRVLSRPSHFVRMSVQSFEVII
jgi:hypothetical protein